MKAKLEWHRYRTGKFGHTIVWALKAGRIVVVTVSQTPEQGWKVEHFEASADRVLPLEDARKLAEELAGVTYDE